MWHDKDDKEEQYKRFRKSTEPRVLVGCGLSEGIDLVEDAGRFQIIGKVPYPSLADNFMKHILQKDKMNHTNVYQWMTIRTIIQAYGRISRTETDYGKTYILDISFLALLKQYKHLFPAWFLKTLKK